MDHRRLAERARRTGDSEEEAALDSGTDRPTTESMIGMPVPDMAMPMSTPPFTAKSRDSS